MPIVNDRNQTSELALDNFSKFLVPSFDIMKILQKQMTVDFSPIFEAQKIIKEHIASVFVFSIADMFKGFARQQSKMFEMLKLNLIQAVHLDILDDLNLYTPQVVTKRDIFSTTYDAEIVEDGSNIAFGLEVTTEGRFIFEGHVLKSISTNSKHGKLLKMLLINEDNYVTDEVACKVLDVDGYRGLGYLRRDLKKALKESGLQVNLYREHKTAFKLLEIYLLPN